MYIMYVFIIENKIKKNRDKTVKTIIIYHNNFKKEKIIILVRSTVKPQALRPGYNQSF
jgi:hypothetical protein